MDEAKLWLAIQLFKHARHRCCNWPPLVDIQWLVDSHADEKHDEVTFKMGSKSTSVNHGQFLNSDIRTHLHKAEVDSTVKLRLLALTKS